MAVHPRSSPIAAALRRIAAAAILPILVGCAAAPTGLVSERSVPELRLALDAKAALGNRTLRLDVAHPGEPSRALALHLIHPHGVENPPDRVLVGVHGILADHRAWRFVAATWAQRWGVWLADLPGCGDSDVPPPTAAPVATDADRAANRYDYRIDTMAADLLEALRQSIDRLDLAPDARLTLLGHSLGGQVVLRIMGDPDLRRRFPDVLARVDSAVLIAGLDISVYRQDPDIRRFATASRLELALADALGISRSLMRRRTLESVSPPTPALLEEAALREFYVTDPRRLRAQQAIVARAVPWRQPEYRRPDWEAMEAIEAMQRSIAQPVLILWGRRDEILPVSMGFKLAAELPAATLVVMDGVMHSPQIERPTQTASIVEDFIDRLPRPAEGDGPPWISSP